MEEPEIVINGVRLTTAQAMTVRVAVSSFDPDCGDDEHGVAMTKAYTAHANEIFRIMLGKPATRADGQSLRTTPAKEGE